MDENFTIKQFAEADTQTLEAPYQRAGISMREFCTTNRTRNAEGGREDTEGLDEVDKAATETINKQLDG